MFHTNCMKPNVENASKNYCSFTSERNCIKTISSHFFHNCIIELVSIYLPAINEKLVYVTVTYNTRYFKNSTDCQLRVSNHFVICNSAHNTHN